MSKAVLGWVLRHKLGTAAIGLSALAWGSFEAAIRSDLFLEAVRRNAIAGLERYSGTTVSIDELRFGQARLAFEIAGIRVDAGERAAGPPLLSVPHASVALSWRSLLGGPTVLESLSVHDPVMDLTRGAEAWANLTRPPGQAGGAGFTVQRFKLSGGRLMWSGQSHDLEFSATGLQVETTFDPDAQEYTITAELREPRVGRAGSLEMAGTAVSLSAVADETGLEILNAEIRGEDLAGQARCSIRGRQQPFAKCIYSLQSEFAPLAALAGYPEPGLVGALEISGELEWDGAGGKVLYSGEFSTASAGNSALDLDLSLTGRFSGNENGLDLPSLTGSALGGGLRAQASIEAPWSRPHVHAEGTFSGIALQGIANAVGAGPPGWSGSVEADFEISGRPLSDLRARLGLRVEPTARPATLPVSGEAALLVSGAGPSVAVEGFSLETPNIRASGAGQLSITGGGTLQVAAEVDSRQALERLLAALKIGSALPQSAPDGSYAYRGSLSWARGPLADAKLSGDFTIDEFEWGGQHWSRLSLRGMLAPDRLEVLDGRLVDGDGELSMRGSLPLLPDGALNLAISAAAMDTGKLARASGFTVPIEGLLAMQASLTGSQSDPEATCRIAIDAPTFFGERFDRLRADLYYTAEGYDLRNASLARQGSTLGVTAFIAGQTGETQLELEGNHWPLEESTWAGALAPGLAGNLRFELRAAGRPAMNGTLGALDLDGNWEISGLRSDGLELGNWNGTVRSARDAEGVQIGWEAAVLDGRFRGDATLWSQARPPSYNGSMEFNNLSAQRLAELLDLPLGRSQGKLEGRAGFGGVAGSRGTFEMNGTIERAEVSLPGLNSEPLVISNVFPLRWGIKDGDLMLDSMVLTGQGTDFRIDGAIGLAGERAMDVSIDGDVNLRLLEGFAPGIETTGSSTIGLRLRGTLDDPSLEGSVELAEASVRVPAVATQLSNINGTIAFQEGQGKITRLTATSGGGTVEFSGVTDYRRSQFEFRVHASAKDVRVNYPPTIASIIDGDLTLAGVGGQSILNGNVVISRMSTASKLSFSDLFTSLQKPEGGLGQNALLDAVQVNVHVGAIQQLPVETSLVRDIQADFDLNIVGTLGDPSLVGEIQIAQGELRMLGTHYRINRGEIRFIDALQAEPLLSVELETRIRDVDLALVLAGPSRDLSLSYRSDPPLPFHDLVDLVAVGKEPTVDPSIASRRRIEQQSVIQTGADNILSQAISRPVSKRLQRFFGVSRLKVDPQIGGLESNPSARLSTEQQIAEDITLIYSYDLSSAQQQAIRLEWNPDRKWSFIVTRDQNGLLGSDVLYKVRLR